MGDEPLTADSFAPAAFDVTDGADLYTVNGDLVVTDDLTAGTITSDSGITAGAGITAAGALAGASLDVTGDAEAGDHRLPGGTIVNLPRAQRLCDDAANNNASLTTGAVTWVPLDVADYAYSDGSAWSFINSGGIDYMQVPRAGFYAVGASIVVNATPTVLIAALAVNGSSVASINAGGAGATVERTMYLAAGDLISAFAYYEGATSPTTFYTGTGGLHPRTRAWAVMVMPAAGTESPAA